MKLQLDLVIQETRNYIQMPIFAKYAEATDCKNENIHPPASANAVATSQAILQFLQKMKDTYAHLVTVRMQVRNCK